MALSPASQESSETGSEAAALRDLVEGFSIEVTPRAAASVPAFRALLEPGTAVYVTHIAGTPYDAVIGTCARLRAEGMTPVPHLGVRAVPDRPTLDRWLGRLTGEAGVDALLLIAGSAAAPVGPFADTLAVLDEGWPARHGLRRLGVAGHPEGHPAADDAALWTALDAKRAYAETTGTDLWLVTQFVFDAAPLTAWLERLAARGTPVPVRAGLPAPATPRTLLRYALQCGIGASLQTLRRRPDAAGALFRPWTPDRVLTALARRAMDDRTLPLAGIHAYPFGGVERAAAWFRAVAAGAFTLTPDGGLVVSDTAAPAPGRVHEGGTIR